MSAAPTYASRYTHVLSLVEAYLLEFRRNKTEIPRSRFSIRSPAGTRRDERGGIWAVIDHIAATESDARICEDLPRTADFRSSASLGSGRFGTVEVVSSAYDGQLYAMKTISKSAIQRSGSPASVSIERHIHLLATSRDQWVPIPALHAAFLSQDSLHLVIDLATCGSLWDRMGLDDEPFPFASPKKSGNDTDDVRRMQVEEIRWWTAQMVEAIIWIHAQGYAHRDIKPQNFLIDDSARILLTDFGVAAPVDRTASLSAVDCAVPAGTPDYIAPEVLLAGEAAAASAWDVENDIEPVVYTSSIDYWSLGATIYEMATGQAPFVARSIADTYARITSYNLDRAVLHKHCADPALRTLINGLLCPARQRLDAREVRLHPFFAGVDWADIASGVARPPPGIPPVTPRGLDTEHTFDQSNGFSFSLAPRYDQTSPASNFVADFTQFTQQYSDPAEWLGWTWMPDPADLRDGGQTHRYSPVKDLDDRYRTPMRQTSLPVTKPPPSTAKRIPKKTPGSNPYYDLLKCVHESARKKQTPLRPPLRCRAQQSNLEDVERDVSKLIGNLEGLRTRLNKLTR